MTSQEVIACLRHGADLITDLADKGCNAVILGEMGIGNTSSAALLLSRMLTSPIDLCVGRGTGHDDVGLQRKRAILSEVHQLHAGTSEPLAILATVGGYEIAMMVGAILEAAHQSMTILIDGFIVTAALSVAAQINPHVLSYSIFAHISAELGHREAVRRLGGRSLA